MMREYLEYLRIKYKHQESDCYSLVKLFYKNEFGILLSDITYELDWAKQGLNLILDTYEELGFNKTEAFDYGNVIVFTDSGYPKHLGICLGDSTFLHTTKYGTARHSYGSRDWSTRIVTILKHRSL